MEIKARTESEELMILRLLRNRMEFSEKEEQHFFNLDKGYKGELLFDSMLEKFSNDSIMVVNDLLLEHNNTHIQIDSLLIINEIIYLLNIKNNEGDYYVKGDKWFTFSGNEINSPYNQLNRCASVFGGIMKDLGFTYSTESLLIFVNPQFYLYLAPLTLPAIFPTQINRFLRKITSKSQHSAKTNNRNRMVAEKLASLHIEKSPYAKIPPYSYEGVKKGFTFKCGHTFNVSSKGKSLICNICDCEETLEDAVLRSVKEHILLFPERKITTNGIFEWCGGIFSKKQIRRVLCMNCKLVGRAQLAHFIFD